MQLIYAGKTDRCHPQGIEFPHGFQVSHSPNMDGFRAASITEALDPQSDFGDEDPFKHLL